jgi:tRNA (pseudouridine54-N1)-methyltransferase
MAFVLGDNNGMTAEEESLLSSVGVEVVALGPTSLHADHCIVVTNWLLDTNAFMSDRG